MKGIIKFIKNVVISEQRLSLLMRFYSFSCVFTLLLVMLMQTADVSARLLFRPIIGADEIISFGMAIVVSYSIFSTALSRGHVMVDLLLSRFSSQMQRIVASITLCLTCFVIILIGYENILLGLEIQKNGIRSSILGIPIFPFRYIVAFGCILAFLSYFVLFLRYVRNHN